mmetsp:Transcript_43392/g.132001  ORF Transcript_43392/g.132001 Transcript_43392/m.132001 type:complete len:151 (-) Transcript_43392:175-627(-)
MLPGFEVVGCESDTNTFFLFHPRRGELIFGCNSDGDLSHLSNEDSESFWTRPTASYDCFDQERADFITIIDAKKFWRNSMNAIKPVERVNTGPVGGPVLPLVVATLRLQCFARRVLALASAKKKVMQVFLKRFDDATGLFYFYDKRTGDS